MNRILIIERESSAIEPIKKIAEVLNLYPTTHLTWDASIKLIPLSEISAVFVNVEMPRIDVQEIVEYFNYYTREDKFKIPVYFLYSQKHEDVYDNIKNISHAGKLSKPFKLEEIYYLLEKDHDLSTIKYEQFDLYHKLRKFKDYSTELNSWLATLKLLLKK